MSESKQILFYSAKTNNIDELEEIKDAAELSIQDESGNTLYHCAASAGQIEVIRYLKKRGVKNFDALNKDGETALFKAVWKGDLDVVKCLVDELEVDLDVVNKEGKKAVDIAKHLHVKSYLESFAGDFEDDGEDDDDDDED